MEADEVKIKKKEIEITFFTRLLQTLVVVIIAASAGASKFLADGTKDNQLYNTFGFISVVVVVATLIFTIFVYRRIQSLINSL